MPDEKETTRLCPCCANNGTNSSQSNASNVWQTMVKTVRDVDTQKVTDTKEDIDTLLVFAGLFSAVVTTFVVAVYPNLQPSDSSEIVFLLRQSLAKNYTMTDGFLNSSSPFPTDPTFQAPLWALRVNGLWFASLIVSLSTASIGMLVKQWLIEYLAMDWISPQEQLRARQYRYPGLEHWKVFEIAGILPLFLHLSLGLFFIGLCFFTAAVHETIGRSTLPLVAGWAFFVVMTVFAPLITPRCPYKVTLLKAPFLLARRYGTSRCWYPIVRTRDFLLSAGLQVVKIAFRLPFGFVRVLLAAVLAVAACFKESFILYDLFACLLHIPFLIVFAPLSYLYQISGITQFIYAVRQAREDEEEDVMKQPLYTHDVLLSVDAVLVNDGPILETMVNLVKQTNTPPDHVVAFVLGCLKHRIGAADSATLIPDIYGDIRGRLNLLPVSDSAQQLLLELVADTLSTSMEDTDERDHWIAAAAAILLSDNVRILPRSAYRVLCDPSRLPVVLTRLRELTETWRMVDIVAIVRSVFMLPRNSMSRADVSQPTSWRGNDCFRNQEPPITDAVCKVITQIILEPMCTLYHQGGSTYPYTLVDDETLEAISILLTMLNLTLPSPSTRYSPSFNSSGPVSNPADDSQDALTLLSRHYVPMASKLAAAVEGSSTLILGALMFYQALITGGILNFQREELWEYFDNREKLRPLLSHPIMSDLWRFLLKCARSSAGSLQVPDFVKLCLVLVDRDIPRLLKRDNPVSDWRELVPILVQTADAGLPIEHYPGPAPVSARDKTISALARRALSRIGLDAPDIPQELRTVLGRLAAMEPSISSTGSHDYREGRTVLDILNPMRRNRRPTVHLPPSSPLASRSSLESRRSPPIILHRTPTPPAVYVVPRRNTEWSRQAHLSEYVAALPLRHPHHADTATHPIMVPRPSIFRGRSSTREPGPVQDQTHSIRAPSTGGRRHIRNIAQSSATGGRSPSQSRRADTSGNNDHFAQPPAIPLVDNVQHEYRTRVDSGRPSVIVNAAPVQTPRMHRGSLLGRRPEAPTLQRASSAREASSSVHAER